MHGGCDKFGSRPLAVLDRRRECGIESVAPINAQRQRRARSTVEEAATNGRTCGAALAVHLVGIKARTRVGLRVRGRGRVGVGVVARARVGVVGLVDVRARLEAGRMASWWAPARH